jgi:death-on-curing protein
VNITFLTLNDVLAIHDNMISLYGGSFGTRDLGLIESAIARPKATFGGEDLYPTILEKAAAFFHSLLFNHAFFDGNKRTAIASCVFFLESNRYVMTATQSELSNFPVRVENEHLSIEQIASWLEQNSKIKE